jgi:CBS domain-containing protein
MKVSDIMTTELVSVSPDTPFKEVVERLVRSQVSSLPVVDSHGALVGIITEADLISKEAYGGRRRALGLLADVLSGRDHDWVAKSAGLVAADVMTKKPIGCSSEEDVRSVARRMLQLGIKHMPVVDLGILVGIVSRHDMLAMFDRPDKAIAADVRCLLTEDLNMPENSHVNCSVDHGVVTLTGDVHHRRDGPIVVSMVRDVPGVVDVISRLDHRCPNARPSTQE